MAGKKILLQTPVTPDPIIGYVHLHMSSKKVGLWGGRNVNK